jgi:hypothetical protein
MCSAEGRTPDESKVQKIRDWPDCEDLTDVRAFLGTLGLMRIFIKDFATHAKPLVNLTRKGIEFRFEAKEKDVMEKLKHPLIKSPAIRQIDYASSRRIILSVDSSYIAIGFILYQVGKDGKEYPSRFGSITWTEHESRYSQAKLELYGLFHALCAYRLNLVGAPNLLVRTDTKYIKGMLKNPDIQPNTTINRWITAILLFNFELEHTPGITHAPDSLSWRKGTADDPKEEIDVEEWIDKACGFSIQAMNWGRVKKKSVLETISPRGVTINGRPLATTPGAVFPKKETPKETVEKVHPSIVMKSAILRYVQDAHKMNYTQHTHTHTHTHYYYLTILVLL